METIRVPNTGGFSALPTGTILDRYRIESVIAAGGFGITYLAQHVTLEKPYALKEHFPRQLAYREATTSEIKATDPDTYTWALDRFVQEGRTLAQCQHPNVVSVADVFGANGTAYMALGYEQGQSFRSWLEALGRRPSQAELDAILTPLLSALEYVHGKGLLHRDIAPDNIMIRMDGTPCLIDFGAARQAVAERSQMMSAIVKFGFSPPEQYARSGRAQGPWSDIYALGATLYRAVSGNTPQEATERQIDDELRPVSDLVAPNAYRSGFLDAIDTALRLRHDGRPQTISAWREQLFAGSTTDAPPLQRAQATRQVTFTELPSPPSSPTPLPPPGRPRRAWQIALGGATTILIAGAAGWWLAPRITQRDEERKVPQGLAAKEIAKAEEQLRASKALLKSQEEQRKKWSDERAKAISAKRDPIAALVPGSGQSARDRLPDGRECAFCPEMVVVPAGTFTMGSPNSEAGRTNDEGPLREVRVRQPFAVGKFEVTFAEWQACVDNGSCTSNRTPDDEGWGRGQRPVVNVSWDDTKEYVNWLSRASGKQYRLLTEAEWEYAARASTLTRWSFGNDDERLGKYAWFTGNSSARTQIVGQKAANAWGLHDMHGNVLEWVEDCWIDNYKDAPNDERARAMACADNNRRVIRGGSWHIGPQHLRSAFRHWADSNKRGSGRGFRVARSLNP